MCRLRYRRAWVAAGALMLAAAPAIAAAQPNADSLAAALGKRLASAVARREAMERRLDSLGKAALRATTPDSIVAGALTMRIPGPPLQAGRRARLERATQAAWDTVAAFVGPSAGAMARTVPIEFVRIWSRDPGSRVSFTWVAVPGPAGPSRALTRDPDEADLRDAIVDLLSGSPAAAMPPAVRAWSSVWTPVVQPAANDWTAVAFALATSASSVAHDCLRGVLSACHTVLALAPSASPDWWRVAYREEDWRSLVAEWRPLDAEERALARRCVQERRNDACAHAMSIMNVPQPAPIRAKQLLIAHAITIGGDGAFERLVTGAGTPASVLAAVAGASLDIVVAGWQQKVAAARLEHSAPGIPQAGVILAWALVFGALATRRRP